MDVVEKEERRNLQSDLGGLSAREVLERSRHLDLVERTLGFRQAGEAYNSPFASLAAERLSELEVENRTLRATVDDLVRGMEVLRECLRRQEEAAV